ncbi:MAG: hypothetical protein VKK04_26905 [Synechococcales bacterium]|nr:hypothetical protein [Synechococcales bacterium]
MPLPSNVDTSRDTLQSVIDRIFATGRITNSDKDWLLKAALSNSELSSAEMDAVRRVFDRLKMGLVKVTD